METAEAKRRCSCDRDFVSDNLQLEFARGMTFYAAPFLPEDFRISFFASLRKKVRAETADLSSVQMYLEEIYDVRIIRRGGYDLKKRD